MKKRYSVAKNFKWAIEINTIYLVCEVSGKSLKIKYPDAAFFDFFVRGYSFEKAVSLIGHVASVSFYDAQNYCSNLLFDWEQLGLIQKITTEYE